MFELSTGIAKQLSRQATGNFSIFHRDIGYFGSARRTDAIGAGLDFNYQFNRNWTGGINISYEDSDSNEDLFQFDRFSAGIFTVYRF